MLHHHGGAGSPYMAPPTAGTAPFPPTPTGFVSVTAIPPPPTQLQPAGFVSVTAIPPPPTQLQPAGTTPSANFEELPAGGAGAGAAANLQEEDVPADIGGGSGSGAGASGSGGHRWPREETLALIRIRTEMDADFRIAPLKAPLWEDVARKLAGLGYHRSAKKCKEKFENVDKYYRRTKDARAGRQDGKSYRFFSQLEALHAAAQRQQQATGMASVQSDHQPSRTMAAWTVTPATTTLGPPGGAALPDISFSSMSGSDSDSDSESDDDLDDDAVPEAGLGKGESGSDDREMMAIFEGMMKQVTEKQDSMQRVFLETLERWEAERTAREEAWRRQEVARMNREREQLARERAAAASRDAALIAFLQRVGGGQQQGEPVRLPPPIAVAVPVPAPMPHRSPPSPHHDAAAASLQPVLAPPKPEEARAWPGGEGSGSSSLPSRWPKEEVQALIQLRTEKDEQYHDVGAKGPLWEDIAAGMRRIGYHRSAKRCKEKWENINKYYKKVKESNKRRPEDSKTCPYFHQLDAMYRKKRFTGGGISAAPGEYTAAAAVTVQENPNLNPRELEGKSSHDAGKSKIDGQRNVQGRPGNSGETGPATTVPDDGDKNKRAEDNMKETNVQLLQQQFGADETESEDNDMGGDYTEEGSNDEDKTKYKTGFQKPSVIGSSGVAPAPPATVAATTSSAGPTSSTE